MDEIAIYRCGECGSEYQVLGSGNPTVLCSDCEQVTAPHGDSIAKREYRVGYTRYVEARRRLTEAMDRLEAGETTLARGGFNDAAAEFEDSVDYLTTAATKAVSDDVHEPSERARKKATCLWQAAEWLSGTSYATERGEESRATQFRTDARKRLEAAAEHGELEDPSGVSVSA
jgi:hypothetical protein